MYASPPLKFGSVGHKLTAAEVSQISQLAKKAGRRPWLILGFHSMIGEEKGDLDDPTVLSLVAFVRSNPDIPGVPEGLEPRKVVGKWPISVIRRAENTFVVTLKTGEGQGHNVTLERRGRAWVITDYRMWIV